MKCVHGSLIRLILATALAALSAAPLAAQEEESGLTARIETWGRYYRANEPVLVRIVLQNNSERPISNKDGLAILANLELSREGASGKKPASPPALDPATQPRLFAPGIGHMMVTDLAELFPELKKPGFYVARLQLGDLTSEPAEVMVAHPYNEDADYAATLKTIHGEMRFDLLESVAPDHVRNFVDLARQGLYNGTLFHVIAPGEFIMGGAPPDGDPRSVPYVLPPELSSVPHERGTLSSVRTSPNGADNSVQFLINLNRKEEFDGNLSLFGRIVEGEDTLTKLEGIPTSLKNFQPYYKPLEDVVLQEVIIHERPQESAAGPATQEGGDSR